MDLVLQESTAGWKIKRRLRQDTIVYARQRTLEAWQEKWDIADTGRHIYATIPPINRGKHQLEIPDDRPIYNAYTNRPRTFQDVPAKPRESAK